MKVESYKVYGYRWVVLAVFMLITLAIQVMWICFAPITGKAASFYGISDLQVGFFAMSFMIVYVPLSIPIAWMIDTMGYRKAVSIGAVLMGVAGLMRGLLGANYLGVLLSTLILAAAQPFMLNAISPVAAKWFPIQERATASGLVLVANFLGIGIGQVLSPALTLQYGIPTMLMIYGIFGVVTAALFVIFTRENPPTPPCPAGQESRALMLDGLKSMIKMKDIWILLAIFLISMGVFNGISTWIEGIIRPRGMTITQAGDLGAALLVGGIIGAVILPSLSDHFRRRKIFLLVGMILAVPGMIGIALAQSYGWLMVWMVVLGFFLVSLAPIGYQYGAEITYPAPEGTSNGLLNMAGQISVVFIYGMDALKTADGSFKVSLLILAGMMIVCTFLVAALTESSMIKAHPE
jgi:MFS family permease